MRARSIPPIAAALACLGVPGHAQKLAFAPLPPPPDTVTAPSAATAAQPASGGWQGEWSGQWAPDGSFHGTWHGSYSQPDPTSIEAASRIELTSPERLAWLEQCRDAYGAAGGNLAASGQPDPCESYLTQYDRTRVKGSPAHPWPVMWLRVPVSTQQNGPERRSAR